MITYFEEALENRDDTPGDFQDIVGTFDSTSFDVITEAAKWYGLADMISWWIGCMLGGRKIAAILAGGTLEGSMDRGHLQGDILSPCCGSWLLYIGVCRWHCYPQVGPCHHGMACPQVVDGGTASNMEGSCEYIE